MLADLFTPIKVYSGHFHNSQSKKISPLSNLLQGETRGNKVLVVSVVLHHFVEKRRNSLKAELQAWGTDELLLNSKNNNFLARQDLIDSPKPETSLVPGLILILSAALGHYSS